MSTAPTLTPAVTAAATHADQTADTAVVSLWIDVPPTVLAVDQARVGVVAHDSATTSIALCVPDGLLIVNVPAWVTTSAASTGLGSVAFAFSASPAPPDWWTRPVTNPDLVVTGPAAGFCYALGDAVPSSQPAELT